MKERNNQRGPSKEKRGGLNVGAPRRRETITSSWICRGKEELETLRKRRKIGRAHV